MIKHARYLCLCFCLLAGSGISVRAEVSLPKIVGDNMVLQRNVRLPIWGRATPGEEVTVRFAGQTKRARADGQGRWQVTLDPLKASATSREMTFTSGNVIRLKNILVGEVWLCAGQSNMEYAVGVATAGAPAATQTDAALAEEIKTAHYPTIRLFRVEKKLQPPEVVSDGWSEAGGDSLAKFSAVGYFFARRLQGELGVPVGMIESAWGGSRIEPWTPAEAYKDAKAFAQENAQQPLVIDGVKPGQNYDAMVRPLAPYALRGVLWYQGESQVICCNDGLRYADKMETLIRGWRAAWQQNNLPFYYVQVAPFLYTKRKDKLAHSDEELPKLWEAQAATLTIPYTGMVATTDLVDDLSNIHPGRKRDVGGRLADLALAKTYHRQSVAFTGPTFLKMEIRGSQAVVHFNNVAGGLSARGGTPLTDFEVAGMDGKFVSAEAIIRGDTVIVSASQVLAPRAVRFAWRETARPNLINRAGLPAYPFRTDAAHWPPAAHKEIEGKCYANNHTLHVNSGRFAVERRSLAGRRETARALLRSHGASA